MHDRWTVSLREGVSVASAEGRTVIQFGETYQRTLQQSPPAMHPLFERLVSPGIDCPELCRLAFASGVPDPLARLVYCLTLFAQWGCLTISVQDDDNRCIARLEPLGRDFKWPASVLPSGPLVLSRFACLRRGLDCLLLESPLALARLVVLDERPAGLLSRLSSSVTLDDLRKRSAGLSPAAVEGTITLLSATGFLSRVNESGQAEEDCRSDLQTWEFHDLFFHSRSRLGRHDAPSGATYRFFGWTDPPPAVKAVEAAATLKLDPPDLPTLRAADPALFDVVERRQSIREYDQQPLTLRELSEFLYRTVRVRQQTVSQVGTPYGTLEMDFVSRPYPSGGALYELEVYPLIQRCEGLEPGLYRYDGAGHQLVRLAGWNPLLLQLVQGAGLSASIPPDSIQTLLIISSRFARVAWKYSSIAYALTLKHVGVMYQTMYLTATAMGLAPCGLGGGDAAVFAKAIGGDYFSETSVGEFLLGSRLQVSDP